MKKTIIYLFFGPPGVGKGTVAQACVKLLNWHHISTGALCRKHITEKTELGRYFSQIIDKGNLIPDDMIIDMVKDELLKLQDSSAIILDGFPRTQAQVEQLHLLFEAAAGVFVPVVVAFKAPDYVVVERLGSRIICSNPSCEKIYNKNNSSEKCVECGSLLVHRPDDSKDFIMSRIEIYKRHYDNLINFWQNQGYKVHEISAEKSAEFVFADFLKIAMIKNEYSI